MLKYFVIAISTLAVFSFNNASFAGEKSTLDQSTLVDDEQSVVTDDDIANLNIYGYFSANLEKNWVIPKLNKDLSISKEDEAAAWTLPNFKLMMQQQLGDNFKAYVNLTGDGAKEISVKNYWGEYTYNDLLKIRAGKMYRPFDIYNEKLDAVPSYLGIEAPELFDKDHILLERTTNFMLHGNTFINGNTLHYALTTDNGEGGPELGLIPLGWDLNFNFSAPFIEKSKFLIGTSGYLSSITSNASYPTKKFGEGAPDGGILPWIKESRYNVLGGYFQSFFGNLQFEAAYWRSNHNDKRDPIKVKDVIDNAGINSFQKERFLDSSGKIITDANYAIETYYIRLGYNFKTPIGEINPYAFYDYYKNPETIDSKKFGGDNEAGRSDDGAFIKPTLGLAYRPTPRVTLKIDSSVHIYTLNKNTVMFPEVRLDLSYFFGNL